MKVYTHYPALAPAIKRAGFEPVLLEPLHEEKGPVKIERVQEVLVVSDGPTARPLLFEKLRTEHAWGLVR